MPKGYSKRNQGGWRHAQSSKRLMSVSKVGTQANENNPRWKGDSVSYAALHNWIRIHFTKPENCEHCKNNPRQDSLGRTKLHWANRTKKYLRDRNDWICLCASCHRKYDMNNHSPHKYEKR